MITSNLINTCRHRRLLLIEFDHNNFPSFSWLSSCFFSFLQNHVHHFHISAFSADCQLSQSTHWPNFDSEHRLSVCLFIDLTCPDMSFSFVVLFSIFFELFSFLVFVVWNWRKKPSEYHLQTFFNHLSTWTYHDLKFNCVGKSRLAWVCVCVFIWSR